MERQSIQTNVLTRIFTIRGADVILDFDLARIYGVSTSRLNEQVKRNLHRFPNTFCFQMSPEELRDWMSQNAISNSEKMGMRKLPFLFTEYGVAMVSSVLRTTIAVEVSIHIIQSFIDLKNARLKGELLVSRISNVEQMLLTHDRQIQEVYQQIKGLDIQKCGIFFNDQIFDAYVFSSNLLKKAKKSIVLIDNYVDETTLLQLSKRGKGVDCVVYTGRLTNALQLDLERHNSQYAPIEIRLLKHVHDRFLLIDEKNMYHLGASLKDLGKRWFAFSSPDASGGWTHRGYSESIGMIRREWIFARGKASHVGAN